MCGICGCFSFNGLSDQNIAATMPMIRLMERRGPDDQGFWTDGKNCSFGFRRLAVLDLSPYGHQPMLTSDGRYILNYNGEVYNFRELREELEHKGIRFRSTGDTEVVLNLLALYGKEGLNRLNGMFALAFYDTVQKRLILARDHAGIKPLYYLLSSEGVIFGSQYDQIMIHPWAKEFQVSTEALALYLRFGYIPAPYALLKNTYMLEPGTWLEVNVEGQVKHGTFFEFPLFRESDLRGEEAYEAVDEAVTKAVRRHLVSDVPLGIFLSGGIDSPLLTAKMRAASNGPVRAFTIGTQENHLNESPDAIAYAQEIGVEHSIEYMTTEKVLTMLDDIVASCGEPFADYSVFPTMLIARLARQHVKVVLSGDGGDELFWGYVSRFAPVLEKSNDFRLQPYSLRTLYWGIRKFFTNENGHSNLHYRSIGDWYRAMHTRIPENYLHSIFPDFPKCTLDFGLFAYTGWESNKTAQWLRWNEFVSHLTMVLLKVDRASMYHSLEVRVPYLDREVIDVAVRVDWRSCLNIKRKVGKIPLRVALARHVNHQTGAKRGFEAPMNAWLRGPLKAIFEETVMGRKEILGMPLNQRNLRNMFQQHIADRSDYAGGLWTLLSLVLWEKKHYDGRHYDTGRPKEYQSLTDRDRTNFETTDKTPPIRIPVTRGPSQE
jgi:asparagine synthase (glutamine-hydrolysing)